jgi:hypothetical protein
MSWYNKFVNFLIGEPKGERARDGKGRYIADDKSTKDVNESYSDGRTPVKKKKAKAKITATTTKKKGRGRPKGSKNKTKK